MPSEFNEGQWPGGVSAGRRMKIVILGNSGSGKSTLARRLSERRGCARLDLDGIAWKEADPPVRETFERSAAAIDEFVARHSSWVIEGCYASLIEYASRQADRMIFLNIGVEACVENCRARPWEPEKYPDREAQDENLEMLVGWVRDYATRADEFSLGEHRRVFDGFGGEKVEIRSNEEAREL